MHVANMRPGRAYSYSSRRDHPIHDTYKTSQNTIQCMIMLTSCMIVTPCRRVIARTRIPQHPSVTSLAMLAFAQTDNKTNRASVQRATVRSVRHRGVRRNALVVN